MDLSKLTTSDKLILGGGLAYLIFMFLPWYGIDVAFGGSVQQQRLGLLPRRHPAADPHRHHGLARAGLRLLPDTKLPDLPVPWSQVHLGTGIAAAVIVLLRLLIGSDDVGSVDIGVNLDRKFGLFLALIAAIVVAVGGFLKSKEGDAAVPPAGGGSGSAPF